MWTQIAVILGLVALAKAQCGGELSGQRGTFKSPNYPNNYPKNTNCEWTLDARDVAYTLEFTAFDVEEQTTCNYDYVEVKSGNTVLARLCGSTIPEPITLTGSITITFEADSSINRGGFSAVFSEGASTATAPAVTTPGSSGCGGYFNDPSVAVTSPNYPNQYPSNSDCEYTIEIPTGELILIFRDFELESNSGCGYDYLEVFENGVSKVKMCGSSASSYKASSKIVTLRFKTDSSVTKKGFSLNFERATCAHSGYDCVADCDGTATNDYCEAAGTVCCEPDLSVEGCGVRRGTRIVGGQQADRHEWPWQASLQTTSSSFHFCGATLINNFWAMTAAHCVDGSTASEMKVILGEHHVTGSEEDAPIVTKNLAKVIMHENYNGNGNGFPNDIALVKFTSPVVFTNQINPACLPPANMAISDNDDCWISGWGNTQDSGEPSEILRELNVDVLTNEVCTTKWGSSYINDGHVCLGNGLTGACNGDSGGPLSCKGSDGKWYVNGATSWGRSGCQTEGYPSVYSRVTYFLAWINQKISQN